MHTNTNERNRMMRAALIYVLILATLTGISTAAAAETWTMYAICQPDGEVNIREKPNIHGTVSGRLFFGDVVQVSNVKTDSHGRKWCRVEDVTEWGHGWVCASYLIDTPPTVEQYAVATVRASGRVAVRKEPDGERKGWIQPGETVAVSVSSASWCLTERGYIASEFLEIDRRGY